jgi:hypothetical protein
MGDVRAMANVVRLARELGLTTKPVPSVTLVFESEDKKL